MAVAVNGFFAGHDLEIGCMNERQYGFRLLDDPKYLRALETGLRRIGYRLGDWRTDEWLITHLDVPFIPLGNSRELVLELREDGLTGEWSEGYLFDLNNEEEELAEFDFDCRRRRYERSCYDVWLEEILLAVRKAAGAE